MSDTLIEQNTEELEKVLQMALNLPEGSGIYEDSNYKGCYYRMVDGEKEWINPPFVLGEEYRTTERHSTVDANGNQSLNKVVYAKVVNFGKLPSSSSGSVKIGVAANKIVNCSVSVSNGTYTTSLPFIDSQGSPGARYYINKNGEFTINVFADFSQYSATLFVKYTK